MKRIVFYMICAVVICGCDADFMGMVAPPSDTVNKRFEQSMAWNRSHGHIMLSVPANEYSFYVGSDIHAESAAENLSDMITDLRNDDQAHFAILLGDLIHGKGNFPTVMESLSFDEDVHTQRDTVFSAVGNHDLYFNQWEDYKDCWGTATYHFIVNTPDYSDLFVCLDSASGTLGSYQTKWLKDTLEEHKETVRHIVVFTHTDLFRTDNSGFPASNMPIEETFEITGLMQLYGVDLFLQGHNHYRHDINYRDTRYITVETMQDDCEEPCYMNVSVSDDISYSFINIIQQS